MGCQKTQTKIRKNVLGLLICPFSSFVLQDMDVYSYLMRITKFMQNSSMICCIYKMLKRISIGIKYHWLEMKVSSKQYLFAECNNWSRRSVNFMFQRHALPRQKNPGNKIPQYLSIQTEYVYLNHDKTKYDYTFNDLHLALLLSC